MRAYGGWKVSWGLAVLLGFAAPFAQTGIAAAESEEVVDHVLRSLPLPPDVPAMTELALLATIPGPFPRRRAAYLPMITRAAEQQGLPPAIADAVVRVESGYDPSAVGGVGEIGLMQVRPSTAAMLGFRGTVAELAQPSNNIQYGVAYLSQAWRLTGGDLCRTLMKYRAGHGEERMTPLSVEYCRRARIHLAAVGAGDFAAPTHAVARQQTPEALASAAPVMPSDTRAGRKVPPRPVLASAPVLSRTGDATVRARLIGISAQKRYFAEQRARIEEARARLSAMRNAIWKSHFTRLASIDANLKSTRLDVIAH